jgi:hypothetical protein
MKLLAFRPLMKNTPFLWPRLVAQLLLSPLEQLIEFVDELLKSDMVFLLLDQSAQFVHAVAFLRFHAKCDDARQI